MLEGQYLDSFLTAAGADAPRFTPEEMAQIAGPVDFVGINVYSPNNYVRAIDDDPGFAAVPFPRTFPTMATEQALVGPEALYWGPRHLAQIWNVWDIYITENGCPAGDVLTADGRIGDIDRVMFLRNYLTQLQRATAEGVPVRGYFHWSLLDNFEWTAGFARRFGLHYVDYAPLERTPKLSAAFYRDVIARNWPARVPPETGSRPMETGIVETRPSGLSRSQRVKLWAIKKSLLVSPRPMALLIRSLFAQGGAQFAKSLDAQAPQDVRVVIDERYGAHPDARLDVYTPARVAESGEALPAVVWIHGGGWVGGSKEELGGYFRRIAANGFTVAALAYALAPESRFPTSLRQAMAAIAYLQENAARLHVDPSRLLIAGDSAGAQITAQIATIVTSPAYAEKVKVAPTIAPAQLRGVALCCGPYDIVMDSDLPAFKDFYTAIFWAYSGTRRFLDDPYFATMSVVHHVTEAFPPAFITVGNADELAHHSTALAAALRAKGVEVETLFYPPDHVPTLGHEYQFKIELDDARTALDRLVAFCHRRTQPVTDGPAERW